MSDLRTAAQQALEALEAMQSYAAAERKGLRICDEAIPALRAALAQQAEPVEPVAHRAFLERILTAMEGVIDVADRKTDEFDALRSCVIDLTLMLHTAPPQRPAEPVQEPVVNQQLTTEPVAWIHTDPDKPRVKFLEWRENEPGYRGFWIKTPLYTAPPQRKPLSDADLAKIWDDALDQLDPRDQLRFIARAIERAHGIGGNA